MPSIFTSLNTAYTGLSAHQTMVDTTGHNIANASIELYSRQVVQVSSTSLNNIGNYGTYGIGVTIDTIKDFMMNTPLAATEQQQQKKNIARPNMMSCAKFRHIFLMCRKKVFIMICKNTSMLGKIFRKNRATLRNALC